MKPINITEYFDITARRKWWIITPFLLILLGGWAYIMIAPKIYEATSVILVQSQKVPEDFVQPMISSAIEDRVMVIAQQVISRTNLEKIIRKHDLYSSRDAYLLPVEKVALLRAEIKIEAVERSLAPSSRSSRMQEISAFTISLRYGDARTVAEVVNTLASDFVTENLKMRESHVLGTSAFLFDELASVEERLAKKEEELKQYREKYMGGLPEQLDTNLKILERLQQQLDQLNSNLREAENRKILIQQQIAESTVLSATGEPLPRDIQSLRKELASLELRYSESHPDIIILRKMIAKLETEISKIGTGLAEGNLLPGVDEGLRHQFQNIALEIKDFKAEIKEVQSETRWYEIKVKESPKREQELLILTRNYNNLQKLYDSLFSKKVEAEIAVSMEKKQKGEQFRIIEPAIIPTSPVAPNAQIVIIMTLALGLGLGGGLAVLKEAMDTSYKTPEEVKKGLHLPILAELPIRYTERELKDIKRKNTFAFAAVGLGFILSAIGIALAANGVDKTLDFAKNLFSGM